MQTTWLKKCLAGIAILVLSLGLIALAFVWHIGAWNLVFPKTHHDVQAPSLPALERPALLLFSKTNAFRHKESIAAGAAFFKAEAEQQGWSVYHGENGAVFNPEQLRQFDVVVFLNTSGDTLSEAQRQAFQDWLAGGGGWLGIHAAGDDSHQAWPWYVRELIGTNFIAHIMGPQFQQGLLIREPVGSSTDPAAIHPAVEGLPEQWLHREEWYSWDESPRGKGFDILLRVDESSYSPRLRFLGEDRDLSMGDHPIAWSRCVGKGRSLYSALGHEAAAFEQAEHRQLLVSSVAWLLQESDCKPMNAR